jgi:hypothetical protein
MKLASASKSMAGAITLAGWMLAAAPLTVQAQIMKCIGKDGRIEFAANCPPGTRQQDTGVGTSKPAPAPAASKEGAKDGAAAPKSLADRDAEFRKRQTEQKEAESKAAQKTADDAERVRACNSAKSNLQALKDRQRMFRNDPKTGERVMFEEADFQRELPITERLVAENCKT